MTLLIFVLPVKVFEEGEGHNPISVFGGSFWEYYEKLMKSDLKQGEKMDRIIFHQCKLEKMRYTLSLWQSEWRISDKIRRTLGRKK